jgi:cell division protein FtsW
MSEIINSESPLITPTQRVTGKILTSTRGDKVIWAIVILLTMISILVVYSSVGSLAWRMNKSAESYLFRQIAYIFLGVLIKGKNPFLKSLITFCLLLSKRLR